MVADLGSGRSSPNLARRSRTCASSGLQRLLVDASSSRSASGEEVEPVATFSVLSRRARRRSRSHRVGLAVAARQNHSSTREFSPKPATGSRRRRPAEPVDVEDSSGSLSGRPCGRVRASVKQSASKIVAAVISMARGRSAAADLLGPNAAAVCSELIVAPRNRPAPSRTPRDEAARRSRAAAEEEGVDRYAGQVDTTTAFTAYPLFDGTAGIRSWSAAAGVEEPTT